MTSRIRATATTPTTPLSASLRALAPPVRDRPRKISCPRPGPWTAAPTILALTVYAIFPILRNTVTGLEGVDGNVVDAARGMGMGTWQRLGRVRLPLAWPVILNGIRVATIMVVAIAAIGAAVQGPGLGQLIFRGLSRTGGANALNEALSGVVGVVAVALILDVIFVLIARLTTPRGLHV